MSWVAAAHSGPWATLLEVLASLWARAGMAGRIAAIVLGAALLLWVIVLGLRRLGRARRRTLLWGFTIVSLVGAAGMAWWSYQLPQPRGSYFVMWHQLVRVGAALGATALVMGSIGLLMPWGLDRLERAGFVNFVAVRHVRASKSGFLTVISFLSIAGVGVSSFALCAVVSIMGGFGADLKRKILGNNAHIRIE